MPNSDPTNANTQIKNQPSANPGQANESGEPRNQPPDPAHPNDVREAKADRRANSPDKEEA